MLDYFQLLVIHLEIALLFLLIPGKKERYFFVIMKWVAKRLIYAMDLTHLLRVVKAVL